MGVKMLSVQPLHATSAGSCEKVGRRDPLDPHFSLAPPHFLVYSGRKGEESECEGGKKNHQIAPSSQPLVTPNEPGLRDETMETSDRARGIFLLLPVSAVNLAGQGEATAPHAKPR